MQRNQQAYCLAQDWVRWLDTRRFLGKPDQKNILAQLQMRNKASRGAPDAPMSAEISAFNLAVTSLPKERFVPFVVIYCEYRPKPIKTIAYEFGIQAPAFYERAHLTALEVLKVTRQLVILNGHLRNEIKDYLI
jgi:hypothetical protein